MGGIWDDNLQTITLCLQVINVLALSSHHVFIILVCYPGARPCH